MSIIQVPSGRWRLQIRKRHLKIDQVYATKEAAQEAEAEYLQRHSIDGKGMTLNQLWPRYVESQMFEDKAPKTQSTERGRMKHVLAKLGHYRVTDLAADTNIVSDYIDARRKAISPRTKKKMSNTSVRLEAAALSALITFAVRRKIVNANFVSNIPRPAGGKRKRRVSPEEQGRLAIYSRNSDPKVAQAARFQLLVRHLGCRPGELMGLLVKDVALARRELTFWDTKNKTDRRVHITAEAMSLLQLQLDAIPENSPYLFPTWSRYARDWGPYGYANGVKLLKELKVVDLDYRPHAGRREFVSRAIEANVPLMTIKKQTGHKSTQALEIYDQGLSTAPEIRQELDQLAAKVKDEGLMGALKALGLTPEQERKLAIMQRKHMDGDPDWVNVQNADGSWESAFKKETTGA